MIEKEKSGSSSIGRVSAFQAEGCGFETRLPLQKKEKELPNSFSFFQDGTRSEQATCVECDQHLIQGRKSG